MKSKLMIGVWLAVALSLSMAEAQNVAKQPKARNKKEQDAVMALIQAQDADSRIKAGQDLLNNFAETEFKAIALQVMASSYQEKNDFENMVIYAERTIEADPKNYAAMLMLAQGYVQHTKEFDLDKEEKLGKVEKYGNDTIETLKTTPKPRPDITDDQWDGAKKEFTAQAWEALGMASLVRKKYDEAATRFKTALDLEPQKDPATQVRLAMAYNGEEKWDDALAVLNALTADPNLPPVIKQFAGQEKLKAATGKAKK